MELKIEGVSYRPSVPITVARTLDESLDMAHAIIPYSDRKEPFTPYSFSELNGERWIVGADVPTQVKGLRNKWQHDLTLIEETKRLETMFISAKVITKHEYRDYLAEEARPTYQIVSVHDPDEEGYTEDDIAPSSPGVSAVTPPVFTVKSSQEVRNKGAYTPAEIEAFADAVHKYSTKPYAVWVETTDAVIAQTDSLTDDLNISEDDLEGLIGNIFEIHYFIPYARVDLAGSPILYYEIKYQITPVLMPDRSTNKTVREVIEELIADAEQLRHGDKPRIRLDPDEAARLEQIEAPEDTFSSSMTLFEALLKVGDWDGVCGIPRLHRDVLTFQRWGDTKVSKIRGRVISSSENQTADDYCTILESAAANMVDDIGNPVVDPFSGGYQTVRTEEGSVEIEDGTMCIRTAFPIWQVTKLMLGYVGGNIQDIGGDMTPYVFEKTEYDLLSEFTADGFPNSKGFALYYAKGSPNIGGLSFVPRTLAGDLGWMQYNAIELILQVKFGKKPGLESKELVNLPFRVSYIPYISARIRQHRTSTNGIESALAYGQGGNVISARSYGNHLRGKAQMIGLPERTIQVIHATGEEPAPGARTGETDYIGSVMTEIYPTYSKSQVTMSPNYNRINRFIDIKKDLRQYEIPMGGSTERNIVQEDYIVLGEYEGRFDTMISDKMQDAFVSRIMGRGATSAEIQAAVLATSNKHDKTDGIQVVLPLVRMPIGNSVMFYVKYKDNYSAGTISSDNPLVGESRRFQREVRYTDYFGNAKYLHADFVTGASIPAGASGVDAAHRVPLAGGVELGQSLISTGSKPILLNKDARESISLTCQIHLVSNTDIIIGSEMAARAPWMAYRTNTPAMVYFYASPINAVTGEAGEADRIGYTLTDGVHLNVRYIARPDNAPTHRSWAVKQDGVFLFGANSPMPERVYINFRDRLREKQYEDGDGINEQIFITWNTANLSHVNIVDHMDKGGTYTDNFKANRGYLLPDTVTVKIGGVTLPANMYTWNKKSGALIVPDVTDKLEITVFAVDALHTVVIKYEFWDQWGNDLLYTEYVRGTYPYGFRFVIPRYIYHEHEGELRKFDSKQEAYTVLITKDTSVYEDYYLVVGGVAPYPPPNPIPPDPPVPDPDPDPDPEPEEYDVDIQIKYLDEDGAVIFTDSITGKYPSGTVFTLLNTESRTHKGKPRSFDLSGYDEDLTIVITSDYSGEFTYNILPLNKYNVYIGITYYDEFQNQELSSEVIEGEYEEGDIITIPATVYKWVDYGGSREGIFSLQESDNDVIITVSEDIRKSYSYSFTGWVEES
ncbi:MAG: hypothetical protein J6S41_04810 [Clostridia bacterium]|nr:hypothetical protein [Clostridia bacterium]